MIRMYLLYVHHHQSSRKEGINCLFPRGRTEFEEGVLLFNTYLVQQCSTYTVDTARSRSEISRAPRYLDTYQVIIPAVSSTKYDGRWYRSGGIGCLVPDVYSTCNYDTTHWYVRTYRMQINIFFI